MIREAALFLQTEHMIVEVLGRIRGDGWRILLPPLYVGPDAGGKRTMRQAVTDYAREQAQVPDLLAGGTPAAVTDPLGEDPQAAVVALSAAACAAVAKVDDPDAVVSTPAGDLSTAEYLIRLDIGHCFLAHDVAMYLGSRACPYPEDLARAMWERTEAEAERWRSLGMFREPLLPMPADVSWRDRFLRTAGKDPHPVIH